MNFYDVTLAAPDLERAVFGLVATTDDAALLLAQLEARTVRNTSTPTARPGLTPRTIAAALADAGGSVLRASRALGVPRSTLRDAIARHGVGR